MKDLSAFENGNDKRGQEPGRKSDKNEILVTWKRKYGIKYKIEYILVISYNSWWNSCSGKSYLWLRFFAYVLVGKLLTRSIRCSFPCTLGIQTGNREKVLFEASSGRKTLHRRWDRQAAATQRNLAERNENCTSSLCSSPTSRIQKCCVKNCFIFITSRKWKDKEKGQRWKT